MEYEYEQKFGIAHPKELTIKTIAAISVAAGIGMTLNGFPGSGLALVAAGVWGWPMIRDEWGRNIGIDLGGFRGVAGYMTLIGISMYLCEI